MILFKILAAAGIINVILVVSLVIGEKIVAKKPKSQFAGWWRRNIIGIMH
jgi:hypothetical protein